LIIGDYEYRPLGYVLPFRDAVELHEWQTPNHSLAKPDVVAMEGIDFQAKGYRLQEVGGVPSHRNEYRAPSRPRVIPT